MNDRMIARKRILTKLAQSQNQEAELKAYFERALAASVANAGSVASKYSMTMNSVLETYQVVATFTPALKDKKMAQSISDLFYTYVKSTKPELSGKVSLLIQ